MDWGNLLLGVLTGGGSGLLGTLIGMVQGHLQHRRDMAERRLDMEARVQEFGHEVRLHELNQQARAQETEAELAITSQRGSFEGLRAAISHDQSLTNTSKWVNDVRALFRPALTAFLIVMVIVFWFSTLWLNPIEYVQDLRAYIITSMVYVAVTASVWWFGDRMLQRQQVGRNTHAAGLPWMNGNGSQPSG